MIVRNHLLFFLDLSFSTQIPRFCVCVKSKKFVRFLYALFLYIFPSPHNFNTYYLDRIYLGSTHTHENENSTYCPLYLSVTLNRANLS